jgi:hypothetical protein
MQFGKLETREMRTETRVHLFSGKPEGASAAVTDATSAFSMLSGLAPVFVLEGGS